MSERRKSPKSLVSWAAYDLGNTAYSALVLSSFFPLYITQLSGANWTLGVATTGAMILSACVVPFLGALTDQTGLTKRYLLQATLACIALLLLLAVFKNVAVLIVVFAFSAFFYHISLVLYNSLLPMVAPPKRLGLVSGFGIGMGYLGAVATIPLAHRLDTLFGKPAVFIFAALFFLILTVPLYLFVPERTVANPVRFSGDLCKSEWQRVLKALGGLPQKKTLCWFFLGNFFLMDAINCLIAWFLVVSKTLFQPEPAQLMTLLGLAYLSAFAGSMIVGAIADRWGALKTMLGCALTLVGCVLMMMLAPSFKIYAIFVAINSAIAVTGIWGVGRKVIVDLTQAEDIGEYFGLYGLTTKISVATSLCFAITADFLGFRPALGIVITVAILGCGFLVASMLSEKKRYSS